MKDDVLRAGAAVLAGLLILTAGTACSKRPQQPKVQTPYVETAMATFGAIRPSSSMSGLIAPFEEVAIQSSLSEPADSVSVQEGDHVTKGQVLARLDAADLQAQLDSDLATAQSNQANTMHNVYAGSASITQGNQTLRGAQAMLSRDPVADESCALA